MNDEPLRPPPDPAGETGESLEILIDLMADGDVVIDTVLKNGGGIDVQPIRPPVG